MTNVNLSSKPKNELASGVIPEPIILEDKNWYKIYCNKCPYFWHEEQTDENKDHVGIRCNRPFGEDCLAKSLLVSQVLMMNMHNTIIRKMRKDPDHVLPFKHKKIKRRR